MGWCLRTVQHCMHNMQREHTPVRGKRWQEERALESEVLSPHSCTVPLENAKKIIIQHIDTSIGHATEKVMQSANCCWHTPHTRCWHTIEFLATTNTKQHKEQAAETHVGAVNWVVEQGRNGTRRSSTLPKKFSSKIEHWLFSTIPWSRASLKCPPPPLVVSSKRQLRQLEHLSRIPACSALACAPPLPTSR